MVRVRVRVSTNYIVGIDIRNQRKFHRDIRPT